jgi:hypothetical protein
MKYSKKQQQSNCHIPPMQLPHSTDAKLPAFFRTRQYTISSKNP